MRKKLSQNESWEDYDVRSLHDSVRFEGICLGEHFELFSQAIKIAKSQKVR
jgi:hypothetical protein